MKNLIISILLIFIISCTTEEVYVDVFDPVQDEIDTLNQEVEYLRTLTNDQHNEIDDLKVKYYEQLKWNNEYNLRIKNNNGKNNKNSNNNNVTIPTAVVMDLMA